MSCVFRALCLTTAFLSRLDFAMKSTNLEELLAVIDDVGNSFQQLQRDHVNLIQQTDQTRLQLRQTHKTQVNTIKHMLSELRDKVNCHEAQAPQDSEGPSLEPLTPVIESLGGGLGHDFVALDHSIKQAHQELQQLRLAAAEQTQSDQRCKAIQEAELDVLRKKLAIMQNVTAVTWDEADESGSVSGFVSYPQGAEVVEFFVPLDTSEVDLAQELWDAMEYADSGIEATAS